MLKKVIEKFKSIRKQEFLNLKGSYKHNYAFVGVGNHSISNLYPCIDHLAIPLTKICTRTKSNAEKMAARYEGCTGTDSLQDLINDKSIKGVFVSSSPSSHFAIVTQLLNGGLDVFVEKPPCASLNELQELSKLASGKNLVVGLQKRYSQVNQILKGKVKDAISYNYKYVTGPYPEGDEVLDLYIHALDNIVYLFGNVKDLEVSKKEGTTLLLTKHQNGVSGVVELSTDYSWNTAQDYLTVNTKSAIFEADYPNKLKTYKKSAKLLGVPLEKVMGEATQYKVLINNTGFVPVKENNNLFVQGYIGEVLTFAHLVEGKSANNLTSANDLKETYRLLGEVKK